MSGSPRSSSRDRKVQHAEVLELVHPEPLEREADALGELAALDKKGIVLRFL